MIRKGVIQPSTSMWAAPVVLVPKKDGGMRFCVDHRQLNTKTHLDGYPMPQQHFHHLQEVFEHLHQAGLTLNLKKCNHLQTSLIFLGHVVSREGISTEPSKVEVVQDFPQPQSVKEVQRFLGMAG
ncbi:hypothetical protein MHYP_G00246260 [Metynnis hypsauchen]